MKKIYIIIIFIAIALFVTNFIDSYKNANNKISKEESPYSTYLSARFALNNGINDKALDKLLKVSKNNLNNAQIMEGIINATIMMGDIDNTMQQLDNYEYYIENKNISDNLYYLIQILKIARAIKEGNLAFVETINLDDISYGATYVEGIYYSDIIKYAKLWKGATEGVYNIDELDTLLTKDGDDFIEYNKGVMLYLMGENEKADNIFSQQALDISHLRILNNAAAFWQKTGKIDKYDILLKEYKVKYPDTAFFISSTPMLITLEGTPMLRMAMAEYLSYLAAMQLSFQRYDMAVTLANIALYLEPNLNSTKEVLARTYYNIGEYKKSNEILLSIEASFVAYNRVQQQIIDNYTAQDNKQQAIVYAKEKIELSTNKDMALKNLADLYLQLEEYQQACDIYDELIGDAKNLDNSSWTLFYGRARCSERLDNWKKAEKDFLVAGGASGENPYVLNYLAYSWIERSENLVKALYLLQLAMAKNPNDPYISDSYGWALYKNKRYDEAVLILERSNLMLPSNEIISDHLGDAYWQVGRYNEARHQWLKALHSADAELTEKIKDKLNKTEDIYSYNSNARDLKLESVN